MNAPTPPTSTNQLQRDGTSDEAEEARILDSALTESDGNRPTAHKPALGAHPTARFAALESRNFRILWCGLLASNVGTWMAQTAEGWLVTDLEPVSAALFLGLIAVSFGLPMVLLPPIGGALADRVPRLRLIWIAQVSYLLWTVALAIVTLADVVTVWMLMVYGFANGVTLAFDSPTRQALLPDLVSRAQLMSAISLNSAVFTGAALLGPALAGALIPVIGPGGVFVVNGFSYVIVLWALTQLEGVPQRRVGHTQAAGIGVWRSIGGGLAYVRATPVVGALLVLSLISGLFGRSFGALLAAFARDEFRVGSVPFGLMVAAPGLGTLVGSIWLASRRDLRHKARWILGTTMVFCTLLGAFAATPWYGTALPLLILAGLATTVAAALTATLIQLRVPNELRGRVMSFYTLTLVGVPSIGALLSGGVAEITGLRLAVGGGAALTALLTLWAFHRGRELRAAD